LSLTVSKRSRFVAAVRGLALVALGLSFGILSIRLIVRAGLRQEDQSGSKWAGTFDTGRYYSLLLPLTVPTVIVLVTVHWVHMKLLKHAYA